VTLPLRTKFLLSMLLVSAGLTATSLLLVRKSVQTQIKREIFGDLENSVSTFRNFHREREQTLSRSADLLADLPNLRALMTTQDAATIQDGSESLWHLAGADLFVLADRTGKVVASHTNSPGFTRQMAEQSLATSLNNPDSGTWWFGAQHLYQVFVKPIYFGPASADRVLGFLVIGYEIDDSVASQLSRVAASQVVFYYGDQMVRSTLAPAQEAQLSHQGIGIPSEVHELQLGGEHFLCTSLELDVPSSAPVRLVVLKSYDRATLFLDDLNRLLLALGLAAVLVGSILVFVISDRFTRPLGSLVEGVRALEKGDFQYQLGPGTCDEVGELTGAFDRMRHTLLKTQQELLEAERLATIGRMASSISHDLRHSLAAILANAEFLCESRLSPEQREELYQEVRRGVEQMTELIDSLLEFSRTRAALHPSFGSMRESVDRVIQMIRSHPEFHRVQVSVDEQGSNTGWFDQRKLERALFNLVLNACEAVPRENGAVQLQLQEAAGGIEVRVADNGRGIPEIIRDKIFEPFVSSGKENGTGLGLTVVQKIVQDHGGDVTVEKTSAQGTVFRIAIPLNPPREEEERERETWSSITLQTD
jgi:signal transduction histidine kinase